MLLVPVASAAAAGCVHRIDLDPAAAGTTHLFVGAMAIELPEAEAGGHATSLRSVGVGISRGFHIGYRSEDRIELPLGECRLLLIVRSREEAEWAGRLIDRLKGEDLCMADFRD